MKRVLHFGRAFILLEAMIAVAIFAIGVLALGKCVSSCVAAERFKQEDGLARRALENRIAEIEGGTVMIPQGETSSWSADLDPPFKGMKISQTFSPVKKKNEQDQPITGLTSVLVRVSWDDAGETRSKELTFYVFPRQR